MLNQAQKYPKVYIYLLGVFVGPHLRKNELTQKVQDTISLEKKRNKNRLISFNNKEITC